MRGALCIEEGQERSRCGFGLSFAWTCVVMVRGVGKGVVEVSGQEARGKAGGRASLIASARERLEMKHG